AAAAGAVHGASAPGGHRHGAAFRGRAPARVLPPALRLGPGAAAGGGGGLRPHRVAAALPRHDRRGRRRRGAGGARGAGGMSAAAASRPAVSIVIPVYNEEANLLPLYERLAPVMERLCHGGAAAGRAAGE